MMWIYTARKERILAMSNMTGSHEKRLPPTCASVFLINGVTSAFYPSNGDKSTPETGCVNRKQVDPYSACMIHRASGMIEQRYEEEIHDAGKDD